MIMPSQSGFQLEHHIMRKNDNTKVVFIYLCNGKKITWIGSSETLHSTLVASLPRCTGGLSRTCIIFCAMGQKMMHVQ
jgi:hypothetical protein